MESIQYFQNLKKEEIEKGLYLRDDMVFFASFPVQWQ